MKKSRLNLFRSTSMLISIVGVIMIVSTIIVVGYIGFSMVSSGLTNDISSGNQYDDLALLESQFNNLSLKFDDIKSKYYSDKDAASMDQYNTAKLELTRTQTAIDNVKSALDSGKPSNEVDSRLDFAQKQLPYENKAPQILQSQKQANDLFLKKIITILS